MPVVVDPTRRACVNLFAPDAADPAGFETQALAALGDRLIELGLTVRWVRPRAPGDDAGDPPRAAEGWEAVHWRPGTALAVSPHDCCACVDEPGAWLSRAVRRAVSGPDFLYFVLDREYGLSYGGPSAAGDHWVLSSSEAIANWPVRPASPGEAVFDPPGVAPPPEALSDHLAGSRRRFGLCIGGEPADELDSLGVEVVRAASERGVFDGRDWSFERLRSDASPEPLFDTRPAVDGGLDLCLRLGEGRPGLSARTWVAAGAIVVVDHDGPIGPPSLGAEAMTAAPLRLPDLVGAVARAVSLCEDVDLRRKAAAAARLPANWLEALSPHDALLRRIFARTLAAGRRR